jgi:hypothetical protein
MVSQTIPLDVQELIFRAVRFDDTPSLIRCLTPYQDVPNAIANLKVESFTLLMLAVQSESINCAKILVEDFKCDIMQKISATNDVTALHIAIYEESAEFVEYFLRFDKFVNNLSTFLTPLTLRATIDNNFPILNHLALRNVNLFKLVLAHLVKQFPTPPLDWYQKSIDNNANGDDINNGNNHNNGNNDNNDNNNLNLQSVLIQLQKLKIYNMNFIDHSNNTILTHLLQHRDVDTISNHYLPYFYYSTDLTLTNVGQYGTVMFDLFICLNQQFVKIFQNYELQSLSWLTFTNSTYQRSFLDHLMSVQNHDIFTPILTRLNYQSQFLKFNNDDAKFLSDSILPQFYRLHDQFETKSEELHSVMEELSYVEGKISGNTDYDGNSDDNDNDNDYQFDNQDWGKKLPPIKTKIDQLNKILSDVMFKMESIKNQFPEALVTFQLYIQLSLQYLHLTPQQQDNIINDQNELQELSLLILTLIHRTYNPITNWTIFYLPHPTNKLNLFHQAIVTKNMLLSKLLMYYSVDPMTPINTDNATVLHLPELLSSLSFLQWFIHETNPNLLFTPTIAGVTPMMVATLHMDTCRESIDYIFQQFSSSAASSVSDGNSSTGNNKNSSFDLINLQLFSSSSTNKDSFLDIILGPGSPVKSSELWRYVGLNSEAQTSELMFNSVFCRSPQRLKLLIESQSGHPVSLEVKNNEGNTLLLHCIKNGFFSTIPFLIESRCDLYAINTKTCLNALGTLSVYQYGKCSQAEYELALCHLTGHVIATGANSNSNIASTTVSNTNNANTAANTNTTTTTTTTTTTQSESSTYFTLSKLHSRTITPTNLSMIKSKMSKLEKIIKPPPGIKNLNYDGLYTAIVSAQLFEALNSWGSSYDYDSIVAWCYLGADIQNAILPYHVTNPNKKIYSYFHLPLLALLDLSLVEPIGLLNTAYKSALVSSTNSSRYTATDRFTHGVQLIDQVEAVLKLLLSFYSPINYRASPLFPKTFAHLYKFAHDDILSSSPDKQISQVHQQLSALSAQSIILKYHGNPAFPSHGVETGKQSFKLSLAGFFSQPKKVPYLTPCDIFGIVCAYNNPWLFHKYSYSPNAAASSQSTLQLHETIAPLRTKFLTQIVNLFQSIDYLYNRKFPSSVTSSSSSATSSSSTTSPSAPLSSNIDDNIKPDMVVAVSKYAPLNYPTMMKFETSLFFTFPSKDLDLIKILSTSPFGTKSVSSSLEHWFHFKEIDGLKSINSKKNSKQDDKGLKSTSSSASSASSTTRSTKFAFVNNLDDDTANNNKTSSRRKTTITTTNDDHSDLSSLFDQNDVNAIMSTTKSSSKPSKSAVKGSNQDFDDLQLYQTSKNKGNTTASTNKNDDNFNIDDLQSLFG